MGKRMSYAVCVCVASNVSNVLLPLLLLIMVLHTITGIISTKAIGTAAAFSASLISTTRANAVTAVVNGANTATDTTATSNQLRIRASQITVVVLI